MTKVCRKCGEEKDLSTYYKDKTRKDGHDSICKACKSAYVKSKNNPPAMDGNKTCTKCGCEKHVTEFSVDKARKDGRHPICKECIRINSRKHYEENKDYYKEYGKEYYVLNKEKVDERNIRWRKENPEKSNEIARRSREKLPDNRRKSAKIWRDKNPDKVYKQTAKRRATKLNATPSWIEDSELYSFMLEEIYSFCKLRTETLGIECQVDHIVPMTAKSDFYTQVACGLHVPWNLQIIPASENRAKNCYTWPDKWDY